MTSRFILPFADVGNGIAPSDGAKLFFFDTGTSNLRDTFSEQGATTPNTNPVVSDGTGVFPDIWITGSYKVVLEDKNGVQEWSADPIIEEGLQSVRSYDDTGDMIADMTLSLGQLVSTKGFTSTEDGGHADYSVVSSGTADDILIIDLANGLKAQRLKIDLFTFDTTADMILGAWLGSGDKVQTTEYHAGTKGGANYVIQTAAAFGGTPDEFGDLTLDNTNVSVLQRPDHVVRGLQFGMKPNSSVGADVTNNDGAKDGAIEPINGGGVVLFDPNQYFFSTSANIDDGESLVGVEGAISYRENQDNQVRLTWTADVDAISYNGFNSYRNALKNLKIDNNLALDTSTKTGINFSADGGSQGTRALANVLDNITVQNFKIGINPASAGDFSWFKEWSNIKIFRCQTALIIDGSDGSSRINGLHIDGSAGFTSSVVGIDVQNSNGMSITNYSIEGCNNGLIWNGDEDNDRLYMYGGYYENNSSTDISFSTNSEGQLYVYGCRMAWFAASAKNQSFKANSGCVAKVRFYDLTIRGDQSGLDGLIRVFDIASSSTRVWIEGLLIQSDVSEIWLDSGSGKSPVYIKMLNEDKNSNWFELHRDVLGPTDMLAYTMRNSSVIPTTDTFVIDTPGGGTIDLKYSGAWVKGSVALAFTEWVWDGAAFQVTP